MDPGLPGREWFSYVRYNQIYKAAEMEKILKQDRHLAQIDAVEGIPRLRAIGEDYARANVKIEHLI